MNGTGPPARRRCTVIVAACVLALPAPACAGALADDPFSAGDGGTATGGALEDDPFASGNSDVDVRADAGSGEGPTVDIRPELVTYTQHAHIRDDLIYDPGNLVFNDQRDFVGLDIQWDGALSDTVEFRGRGALWAVDRSPEGSTTDHQELLEGYLYLHDRALRDQLRVGRVNYDWSTAVNWSPANVLSPRRVEAAFSRDDLELQKGWDLVEYRRSGDYGQHALLAADLDVPEYPEADWQAVYRWAGQAGPLQVGLIVNAIEGEDPGGAFTLETAPTDHLILWSEGSYQSQRALPTVAANGGLDGYADEGYSRLVVGGQYALSNAWDLTFEYNHNEHGYGDREWDRLMDGFERDRTAFRRTSDPSVLFDLLDRVERIAGERSLRRNYLYLMLGNATGLQKYEYRQSIEINLDDDSITHYVEFIQNWRSDLSTRLGLLYLDGCERCEAGLRATEYRARLSLYWQF